MEQFFVKFLFLIYIDDFSIKGISLKFTIEVMLTTVRGVEHL